MFRKHEDWVEALVVVPVNPLPTTSAHDAAHHRRARAQPLARLSAAPGSEAATTQDGGASRPASARGDDHEEHLERSLSRRALSVKHSARFSIAETIDTRAGSEDGESRGSGSGVGNGDTQQAADAEEIFSAGADGKVLRWQLDAEENCDIYVCIVSALLSH
jgi:hypothetical protein